jgi:hypothetical protein
VSYTVWTETELTAPTKHGKLRRRRGGGGGGDEDDDGDLDASGGGGNFGNFYGGEGGDWSSNGDGGGHFGGGRGGGGSGRGGGGGGGDEWWSDDRWLHDPDGRSIGQGTHLLWVWQTVCGVAFAGSVQHIVDTSMSRRTVARASAVAGARSVGVRVGEETGEVAHVGLCLASLTFAHLAPLQPVLSISA